MKITLLLVTIVLSIICNQIAYASLPVAYAGKIALRGINFSGQAEFEFSISNAEGVELWAHAEEENHRIQNTITNGRFLVLLGGQGMNPLPSDLFFSNDQLFLHIKVDLNDGGGIRVLPAQPISATFHSLSAEVAKFAESAEIAQGMAPGSVTVNMLDQSVIDSINKPLEDGAIFSPSQLDPKFVRYFTPKIKETPVSTSLIQGSMGSLSVGAEGQFLSYQWFKNGEPLPNATSSSLVVENAKFDTDDANYSVVVTNDWGGVESAVVKVKVLTSLPVITLLEGETYHQEATFSFVDPGATAEDALGNDLSAEILIEGTDFNTSKLGTYRVLYAVTDVGGNTSTKERSVTVSDTLGPDFYFEGYEKHHHPLGVRWREPGVEAYDRLDGDLTDAVSISGTVDPSTIGEYEINYKVSDKSTNESVATRIVEVSDIAMIKNVQEANADGSTGTLHSSFFIYDYLDPEDFNGTFFFSTDDGKHGHELWRSDGTAAGTYMLKNFSEPASQWDSSEDPDSILSIVNHFPYPWEEDHQASDGKFYIFVKRKDSPSSTINLWVSHGDSDNTLLLGEFGETSSSSTDLINVQSFTDANYLYFAAPKPLSSEIFLWRTDGTEEGTMALAAIGSSAQGGYDQQPLQLLGRFDGVFYFRIGGELWRTDGSVLGTEVIMEFSPISTDGPAIELHSFDHRWKLDGGFLFSADDGVHGSELWFSDGTSEGTRMLNNFTPKTDGAGPDPGSAFQVAIADFHPSVSSVASIKDGFFIFVTNQGGQGFSLWKSDASPQGTQYIRSFETLSGHSHVEFSLTEDGILFLARDYNATTGVDTKGLWVSDGTLEGTKIIKNVSNSNDLSLVHASDGNTFFLVRDFNATTGFETKGLWVSDGTLEGTKILKNIVSDFYQFNKIHYSRGNLLFSDPNPDNFEEIELWITDGTDSGTTLLKTFARNYSGAGDYISVVWDLYDHWSNEEQLLFFLANDGVHGRELWQTDGTADGTILFKNLRGFDESGANELNTENLQVFRPWSDHPEETIEQDFFLLASDNVGGGTLWYSDGSSSGTIKLKDFPSFSSLSNFVDYIMNQGILYFVIDDNQHGRELWVSDGTAEGTRMVKDIKEGSESSNILLFKRPVQNAVYFNANGSELWRY